MYSSARLRAGDREISYPDINVTPRAVSELFLKPKTISKAAWHPTWSQSFCLFLEFSKRYSRLFGNWRDNTSHVLLPATVWQAVYYCLLRYGRPFITPYCDMAGHLLPPTYGRQCITIYPGMEGHVLLLAGGRPCLTTYWGMAGRVLLRLKYSKSCIVGYWYKASYVLLPAEVWKAMSYYLQRYGKSCVTACWGAAGHVLLPAEMWQDLYYCLLKYGKPCITSFVGPNRNVNLWPPYWMGISVALQPYI